MSQLQERVTAGLAHRYRVVEAVGTGGMAVVFRAQDVRHDRSVAIKVLKPELEPALWGGRFLREIQIASRLQHPHILPLYDSGEVGELPYYVMPFVAGESLRARLNREGPLPVSEALRIAREVAAGLGHAHLQGVVHRDIKPENILLSGGHVLICDFGIARALELAAGDTPTEPGLAIGTPSYMSPEQCCGDRAVDARADIYSLGCVLFEMLAGEPPFRGATAVAVMAQHSTTRPPVVRRFRRDVPPAIEAAIGRAMAKRPEDRFATAAELSEALDVWSGLSAPAGAAAAGTAILVLPFANLSGAPESEYLSDGISEELIQALSQNSQFRVVARTSAFAFKGRREDVREIGDRLRVDAVVDGSVRVAGDRIRISVQLVDTAQGYELWSAQYERRAGDLLVLEDEIAGEIAKVLSERLAGTPTPTPAPAPISKPPRDPQAHEAYLKGRHHWNRRTEHGFARSVEWFEQAVARCPDDPVLYAALAESHLALGIYGSAAADQVMPKARAFAERALALEPRTSEAHAALATVCALHDWDWTLAEHHFRLAIELKPGYPTGHQWCAMHLLTPLSRLDEARGALTRARELDPLSPAILTSIAVLSLFARDHDRALAELREVLDLDAGFAAAHYFLGQTCLWRGELGAAHEALARAVELSGGSAETVAGLAYAQAVSGRQDEARAALGDLTRRAERSYVSPARIAQVHLGLGDRAEALAWLDRAIERRAVDVVWLGVHPIYDALREERRFAAMLERVGLAGGLRTTRVAIKAHPPAASRPPAR